MQIHYFPLETAALYDDAVQCVSTSGYASCLFLADTWLDVPMAL